MAKKRETLGETIQRIREAKRHIKEGNIEKAIETTPCKGCKDKLRKILDRKKGTRGERREEVNR